MSQPLKAVEPNETLKKALTELSQGEFVVSGKITEISEPKNSDYRYYTLGLEALDRFSLPPVIQLSQDIKQRTLAQENEIVSFHCKVGGYPRRNAGVTYITNVNTVISRIA